MTRTQTTIRLVTLLLGLLATLALVAVARLPGQMRPDTAMMLNRVGRWGDAANIARSQLVAVRLSSDDRCVVAIALAYAETRLARTDSARTAIATAQNNCAGTPNDASAEKQLAQLTRELGSPKVNGSNAAPGTQDARPDDGFWKTLPVAESGLDSAVLEEHRALCERTGADACLVIYHDAIVQEWYSSRYATPMMAMSSTKSIAGLLTAMLIGDGTRSNKRLLRATAQRIGTCGAMVAAAETQHR